jgi:hypothetical protein
MTETTIRPDENMRRAWDFVERTGVSIFLTGKAGTGKTTFLKEVLKNSAKTAVVVAPTGVAAINAGGVTIHSFFQISPAPYIPGAQTQDTFNFSKQKLRVIRSMDLLVIDEISMVRADLLDAVDNALRKYRRDARPFGGVQLLMIGDLQQLAPVVTPRDEEVLRGHYSTPYFFGSQALSQIQYVTIRLEKVFRQQNEQFVELLNHLRDNALTENDRRMLHSRLNPAFIPGKEDGYIRLTTHNASADSYNETQLRMLPGNSMVCRAKVEGVFPELSYPTADELILKPGAQVMFVKNDTVEHNYYNGLIGQVVRIEDGAVHVKVPGRTVPITVTPQVWENSKYKINEQTNTIETEVQGTFTQIPLRLAWAITIHKSQGLTFDRVIIDAGQSFAPGQVYVALSRCRTLERIVLATPIAEGSLRPDPAVAQYISHQEEAAQHSIEMLEGIKSDYYRQLMIDLFTFRDIANREEALQRQVYSVYRHRYPKEASDLFTISERLRSEVIEVSDKWITMLRTMPIQALSQPDFLLRVKKGAVYFYNTIVTIFGNIVQRCAQIKTENKKANTRVAELTLDLKQSVLSQLYLLNDINENGFTISNYLGAKQQAWMKATRDPATEARERRKQERSERKEKTAQAAKQRAKAKAEKAAKQRTPKEPTYEISYKLFKQGLTREEIAKERQMTVGTITRHLTRYVESGELNLDDILSPVMVNAISSVLQRLGSEADYQTLTAALPGVDYNDIRLVAALSNPDGTLRE